MSGDHWAPGRVQLGLVIALSLLIGSGASTKPNDRISVFLIGSVHPAQNPFTGYFMQDPLFTYRLEPIPPDIADSEKQKLDRIYYPRTRQALIDSFDLIIFNDARIQHFTTKQFHDLDFAFREAGMASVATFGPAWEQIWRVSTLYDTSPAYDYTDQWYHGIFWVEFRKNRDPVFDSFVDLGMERILGDAYHKMVEKQGATVWADMMPLGTPFLISWRPGGNKAGLQWVFTDGFNAKWWGISGSQHAAGTIGIEGSNPYAIDMATNLVLYSVGQPLVSDIHARREARYLLSSLRAERSLALQMMEWADSFGANTFDMAQRLAQAEARVGPAIDSYVEQEYADAIERLNVMSSEISEISRDAVRLKNQAMFWVFLSEWLVVTFAAIVSGVSLWTLMVRRRAYKAVRTTRLEGL